MHVHAPTPTFHKKRNVQTPSSIQTINPAADLHKPYTVTSTLLSERSESAKRQQQLEKRKRGRQQQAKSQCIYLYSSITIASCIRRGIRAFPLPFPRQMDLSAASVSISNLINDFEPILYSDNERKTKNCTFFCSTCGSRFYLCNAVCIWGIGERVLVGVYLRGFFFIV